MAKAYPKTKIGSKANAAKPKLKGQPTGRTSTGKSAASKAASQGRTMNASAPTKSGSFPNSRTSVAKAGTYNLSGTDGIKKQLASRTKRKMRSTLAKTALKAAPKAASSLSKLGGPLVSGVGLAASTGAVIAQGAQRKSMNKKLGPMKYNISTGTAKPMRSKK